MGEFDVAGGILQDEGARALQHPRTATRETRRVTTAREPLAAGFHADQADAGIGDILICNEIVGDRKIAALVELSRRIRVAACVDDLGNVAAIERLAAAAGTVVSLMVDVDVGQGRCGVAPGGAVVELARVAVRVVDAPVGHELSSRGPGMASTRRAPPRRLR